MGGGGNNIQDLRTILFPEDIRGGGGIIYWLGALGAVEVEFIYLIERLLLKFGRRMSICLYHRPHFLYDLSP